MTSDALPQPREIKGAAADWYALERSGQMSAAEDRELKIWLDRDASHRAAYEACRRTWAVAGAARFDPQLMAIREAVVRSRRRPSRQFAAAASLVVAILGGWALVASGVLGEFGPVEEQALRTGVGQTITAALPDGSTVTLDTDSELSVRQTRHERLVTLTKGQAFFRVAKDASRPFRVSAAGKTVTATGTAFDVRTEPGRFEVTLVEGRVSVEEPRGQFWRGQSADMMAGWRLTALDDRQWRVTRTDATKDLGWMRGQLIFNNEPLGSVAMELNRYSARKILIRDPAIANSPVIGAFKTGDVENFVKLVQAYRLARVSSETPASIELSAPR